METEEEFLRDLIERIYVDFSKKISLEEARKSLKDIYFCIESRISKISKESDIIKKCNQ
jgi:hypothetical protein